MIQETGRQGNLESLGGCEPLGSDVVARGKEKEWAELKDCQLLDSYPQPSLAVWEWTEEIVHLLDIVFFRLE
jgi:hypothetical protein